MKVLPQDWQRQQWVSIDADSIAVHGQIVDDLLVTAMTDQAVSAAGATCLGWIRCVSGEVVVMLGFLDPDYLVVGEVQDVDWHELMR